MTSRFRKIAVSIIFLLTLIGMSAPAYAAGQGNLMQEKDTIAKAQVLKVLAEKEVMFADTGTRGIEQTLRVSILEGDEKGAEIIIQNNNTKLSERDVFYLLHTKDRSGKDSYSVSDLYRLPTLYLFIGLFVLCVLLFGGIQGIRGLISLSLSLIFIRYLFLPGILHGFSPILLSLGISSIIIVLGSYITHGFNKTTTTAVVGMILTITLTGLLANAGVSSAHLTGFASDESTYLDVSTRGSIDFAGLLLGSMIIGLLGILYDAGISQAIAVEELRNTGPNLPRSIIFTKALRIGREHIGALVNTLAIAYVGASMPLLLLFYTYNAGFNQLINQEVFATEIIRAMVGSVGLILAVPITTVIAVFVLVNKNRDD